MVFVFHKLNNLFVIGFSIYYRFERGMKCLGLNLVIYEVIDKK